MTAPDRNDDRTLARAALLIRLVGFSALAGCAAVAAFGLMETPPAIF